jgi:GDPmannose 4,6-dehydratase
VDFLQGDSAKIHKKLGWRPIMGFKELVHLMVDSDMNLARQERTLVNAGHLVQMARGANG